MKTDILTSIAPNPLTLSPFTWPNLNGRTPSDEETDALDARLKELATHLQALLVASTPNENLSLSFQVDRPISYSYYIPRTLKPFATETLRTALKAREEERFRTMAAHLRLLEGLLVMAYGWGYGTAFSPGMCVDFTTMPDGSLEFGEVDRYGEHRDG